MPAPDVLIKPNEQPEAPHETAPKGVARERRESERVIAEWEMETERLRRALALLTLDTSAMTGEKWAHRFVIALRPVIEDCTLLFYGAKFATLLELPETPDHSVPIVKQLPARYMPVFRRGCIDATLFGVPIRMHGAVERDDGRSELFRAAFIALKPEPSRRQRLAFGAFNCRVVGCI